MVLGPKHAVADDIASISSSNSISVEESALQTAAQSRCLGNNGAQPIAIVGMACKLPGGVNSPSKLWDLLLNEQSGQSDLPVSRFNIDGFYHPSSDRPGAMHMKGGYFIEDDIRNFENSFFEISNVEAQYIDPQQRKLLETVYESFESAGLRLDELSGANVGCYVGNFTMDFQQIQLRDPEYLHRYSATGLGTTILSNRISHAFNLQGPSLVIDTACSSSLYSLHMACVALENGEIDGAVVAGANLIQSPEQHFATMKAGVLSPTSTCHTFDASANGYGRAEGIGALYLKRLEDAIRDGDPIRSLIRGSAVNANGRTPGITLPSKSGQVKVIRKAHDKAGLSVDQTPYVECHGTGTAVGDPIEAEAVSLALEGVRRQQPILIGSVKSNLGHSEAASGITSIIKATLMIERGQIPATVGVKNLNPKIRSTEWNIGVVTTAQPFPLIATDGCRRVGVNSFGYGGANAHAILESAPTYASYSTSAMNECGKSLSLSGPPSTRTWFLLPFSAFSTVSLKARVEDLASWPGIQRVALPDLAATLGQRRQHFKERGFLVVNQENLQEKLRLAESELKLGGGNHTSLNYAFVFTGQGAQWPRMGMELLEEYPVFASAIAEMDSVLAGLTHPPSWTIAAALREPVHTSQAGEVTHSQPLCVAVQIGLVKLLSSWNIAPKAVIGHSSGEIAAAFAANYISLAEAITAAYYRGYVVGSQHRQGAMLTAALSTKQAEGEIIAAGLEGKVFVACSNSPENVTFSGDADAINTLSVSLQGRKLFTRVLHTGGKAYHSHHMQAVGQQYEDLIASDYYRSKTYSNGVTNVAIFSSVTGQAHHGPFDAVYWRRNLEGPVRFAEALSELAKADSGYTLIELGPHSALELPIKQTRTHLELAEDRLAYFSALSRNKNAIHTVLGLMGRLWLAGHDISWGKVNDPGLRKTWTPRVITDLPSYRWNYDDALWSESRMSLEFRNRTYGRHELLGSRIPGGSDTDSGWRNRIQFSDLPWLNDHILDGTVVLPGGGFLAMAIEAVRQASGVSLNPGTSVEMRHVHIVNALTIPAASGSETEIFTHLQPSSITKVSVSETWWDFKISSHRENVPLIHATGTVSILGCAQANPLESRIHLNISSLKPSAERVWYQRLRKVGLEYGPLFQSLKKIWVPRSSIEQAVVAKVKLEQRSLADGSFTASYPIHPITLDAMVQAGIIATAAGQIRRMKGFVPTKFDRAAFRIPSVQGSQQQPTWEIRATASTSGINSAIFEAELSCPDEGLVALMEKSRLQIYTGSTADESGHARHPMLRVIWKPDISSPGLDDAHLTQYLNHFCLEAKSPIKDEGLLKLGAAISLLSHRNSRLSILELDGVSTDYGRAVLSMLHSKSEYKRVGSYSSGSWDDEGVIIRPWDLTTTEPNAPQPQFNELSFDVILITDKEIAENLLKGSHLDRIRALLSSDGVVLALVHDIHTINLPNIMNVRTSALQDGSGVFFLASEKEHRLTLADLTHATERIVILERAETVLGSALCRTIRDTGVLTHRLHFSDINSIKDFRAATVISLLEAEKPLLSKLNEDEMRRLRLVTDNANNVMWVTSGDLLDGKIPEMSLAAGFSRAIMLEQPSLRFLTYDVDDASGDPIRTANNLVQVLNSCQKAQSDNEYIEKHGVVHVARFVPDTNLNNLFRLGQGTDTIETTLGDVKGTLQLSISHPGQFESIYFREVEMSDQLGHGEVCVTVVVVGLNAKDLYALGGKVDTFEATCALEFTGVIKQVGSGVTDFVKGDRVLVMAPTHFRSSEIVPQWAVTKLHDVEDFASMSTMPIVFATALYALRHRSALQKGESVLIHSGAGGVGIAAIQVAMAIGAQVFTTVSTEEKKKFVVEKLGVDPENIFTSRDASFAEDILKATRGQGVDVVLNSLTGDLLRASWRCIGPFGRFVEIGKQDIIDDGSLAMGEFLRNTTFTAFDLSEIYLKGKNNLVFQRLWKQLLCDVVQLLRAGVIKVFSAFNASQVFDVSEASSALRFFSSRNRIGKIAISLEDPLSQVRVQPLRYRTRLDSTKSYIMVGCLGGLGRSLSRWMLERGARKFVFLSRSGTSKPTARSLVEDLTAAGAECQVVQGDVTNYKDVERVVYAVDGKIGGVVQAAMGLSEALFTTMPNTYWHAGIGPKVIGTWNLHNAIQVDRKDTELDFFLMTSSVSGSVGTATESNYCAGNHFLDIFARYRRAQGRPALAIGYGMISEIGYLHENPEIEALLLRKGIQPINEDEFLQITDLALSQPMAISHVWDTAASSHVLTGLEPVGFMELRKMGFNVTNSTFNDPRALVLAGVLDSNPGVESKSQGCALPTAIVKAINEDGLSLHEAVLRHITLRFANMILIQASKIPPQKPLAGFGMDSMIAAELRTWFFQAFGFDISFLDLLSRTITIADLARMVTEFIELQDVYTS